MPAGLAFAATGSAKRFHYSRRDFSDGAVALVVGHSMFQEHALNLAYLVVMAGVGRLSLFDVPHNRDVSGNFTSQITSSPDTSELVPVNLIALTVFGDGTDIGKLEVFSLDDFYYADFVTIGAWTRTDG